MSLFDQPFKNVSPVLNAVREQVHTQAVPGPASPAATAPSLSSFLPSWLGDMFGFEGTAGEGSASSSESDAYKEYGEDLDPICSESGLHEQMRASSMAIEDPRVKGLHDRLINLRHAERQKIDHEEGIVPFGSGMDEYRQGRVNQNEKVQGIDVVYEIEREDAYEKYLKQIQAEKAVLCGGGEQEVTSPWNAD